MLVRLDRFISERTHWSRKEIKALAAAGRVTVDGIPAADVSLKLESNRNEVTVDGVRLSASPYRYFIVNKPAGVVSATEDGRDRTVLELLPAELRKLGLSPAGRLDKDAEGLLILTNDGDYIHSVISPKRHVWKRYRVVSEGRFDVSACAEFERGMLLPDGLQCLPARLELLSEHEALVYVREGKFHQVKRMCAAVGCPVTYLERQSIGGLELPSKLAHGEYREISSDEALNVFTV